MTDALLAREERNRQNVRKYVRHMIRRVLLKQLQALKFMDKYWGIISVEDSKAISMVTDYVRMVDDTIRSDAPPREEVLEELRTIRDMIEDIADPEGVTGNAAVHLYHATFRVNIMKKCLDNEMIPHKMFTVDLSQDLHGGHDDPVKERRRRLYREARSKRKARST